LRIVSVIKPKTKLKLNVQETHHQTLPVGQKATQPIILIAALLTTDIHPAKVRTAHLKGQEKLNSDKRVPVQVQG
jgi:hypothetical protein